MTRTGPSGPVFFVRSTTRRTRELSRNSRARIENLKRPAGEMLPKLHGALLKNEQDIQLFERLAFMARGQR